MISQTNIKVEKQRSESTIFMPPVAPPGANDKHLSTGGLYYQNHREQILAKRKIHYLKNKRRILQRLNQYNKDNRLRIREYNKKFPFSIILGNIKGRCNRPSDKKYKWYGGKRIKNFLTLEDIKYLWNRDKAYLLKQPSIDRKNNSENYTLENCQFIEMAVNRIKRDKV